MSNPLIAVITCHKNENAAHAQRETWAHGAPVKFFYGVGSRPQRFQDEVFLVAPDTYLGLPEKVQTMIRWAWLRGYTHIFKCDDDAYLVPSRLLQSGFEKFSYIGNMTLGYAHGGAGYWIDIAAMKALLVNPPVGKSEDGWVAGVLNQSGIVGHHDPRYQYTRRVYKDPFPEIPTPVNDIILAAEFTPEEMRTVHQRFLQRVDPTDAMSADEYKKYLKEKNA
jgi:hypothetical protein